MVSDPNEFLSCHLATNICLFYLSCWHSACSACPYYYSPTSLTMRAALSSPSSCAINKESQQKTAGIHHNRVATEGCICCLFSSVASFQLSVREGKEEWRKRKRPCGQWLSDGWCGVGSEELQSGGGGSPLGVPFCSHFLLFYKRRWGANQPNCN